MRKKYLNRLKKDSEKFSVSEMARRIEINYYALYRIIKEVSTGSIVNWEKIYKYYK